MRKNTEVAKRKMQNEWETRQRYCPNCGTLGLGYGDGNNRFKFECSKCSLVSILTIKTRRSSATEEYLPKYIARLQELRNMYSEEVMDI